MKNMMIVMSLAFLLTSSHAVAATKSQMMLDGLVKQVEQIYAVKCDAAKFNSCQGYTLSHISGLMGCRAIESFKCYSDATRKSGIKITTATTTSKVKVNGKKVLKDRPVKISFHAFGGFSIAE